MIKQLLLQRRLKRLWREGIDARILGRSLNTCPHRAGSSRYNWVTGWLEANKWEDSFGHSIDSHWVDSSQLNSFLKKGLDMPLRDPTYQSAIELGEADTEYIACLKQERKMLEEERDRINERLARIEELLK